MAIGGHFFFGADCSPSVSMAQTTQTNAAHCAHAPAKQCDLVDIVSLHSGFSLGDRLSWLAVSWDCAGISYSRTGGASWNNQSQNICRGELLRRRRSYRLCAFPTLGILFSSGWLWLCRIIGHRRGNFKCLSFYCRCLCMATTRRPERGRGAL